MYIQIIITYILYFVKIRAHIKKYFFKIYC